MTNNSWQQTPGSETQGGAHSERPATGGRSNAISIDKTIATILGSIASAGLAAGIAGGTALIGKVDETAQQLEKGRTERAQQFGDLTKAIGIIETKVGQLSIQIDHMETRLGKALERDEKRIDQIGGEIVRLREQLLEVSKEGRYFRNR
jgi:hypothetical protein